jgi:hypothetical protein
MKNANKLLGLIAMAIIVTTIIGCKQDVPAADTPKVQPATPRTLSFGTNCKVTITSNDLFTTAEWNTLCDKVVSAIVRGYGSGTAGFTTVFAEAQNTKVVLGNNFTYNWEVKAGELRTVYIKTASIDIVDITEVTENMVANYPGHG